MRTASFDLLHLDEQARAEVLPSGESRAHNRAGWAITYLHRANWIERVSRGTYRITDAGRAALVEHGSGFHDYAAASAVLDKFWEKPAAGLTLSGVTATVAPAVDPMEQIEAGVADLNGSVWKILVEPGQAVAAGQPLIVVEAMKMELAVTAPRAGIVKRISCRQGRPVGPGDALLWLEKAV